MVGQVRRRVTVIWVGFILSLTASVVVATGCFQRDSTQIRIEQQSAQTAFGQTSTTEFYRNPAYQCGVSGDYTFLVINPSDRPQAEAPLWIFLHGGGAGYFDGSGTYRATAGNDATGANDEESYGELLNTVTRRVENSNGQPIDSVLRARMTEGYRILAVSLCDHDLYSGTGTPYPNNPSGGTVDGHLATLAAVDYVIANYPTTDVYAHGTSAGSVGAFSLATSLANEGRPLKAVIADSYLITPRLFPIFDAYRGAWGFPAGSDFEAQGVIDKVGYLVDPTRGASPETYIAGGFAATPVLFIGGDQDSYCAGNQPALPAASALGLNNCDWMYQGLRDTIAAQPNSPHRVEILDGAGHVVTHDSNGKAAVESFLTDVHRQAQS